MNAWRVFRWVLWREIWSGAILGAIFASTNIYVGSHSLLLCLGGFFLGAALGAFLGAFLSIINGAALALLTRLCFTPPYSLRRFRWSALLLSIVCTVVGCLIWIAWILVLRMEVILPVTLLAVVAAGSVAWRLPDALVARDEEDHQPPTNAVLFYTEK